MVTGSSVEDILNEAKGEIDNVSLIMIKLRASIAAAKLRNLTILKENISNPTR